MKEIKIILMTTTLIAFLSVNCLFSQAPPPTTNDNNTFILDVTCKPAFFQPNTGTIELTPDVVAGAGSTTFNANEMVFTIWGDGTKTYDVTITTATNQYPPTGTGPKAYIVTEWTYIDKNQTSENWENAIQGSKFKNVEPIESHCDGHALIKMKAVSGSADAAYPWDDDVPFTFVLSITEN